MANSFDSKRVPRAASFLWVNLTGETHTTLGASAAGKFDVHSVHEPTLISPAIQLHAPQFLSFEFDEPDALGMTALAQIRCAYPGLPVLMITGGHSEAIAIWALRIRVWDLLVKPVSHSELSQHISSLIEWIRQRDLVPLRDIGFPLQDTKKNPVLNGPRGQGKTHPAVAHVTTNFDGKIALDDVAALCRLSPSRFCHVFRQEHGESFGQHLLRYRLERACEHLADPAVLAKEAAYAVGFNDLSYFTRAFKRQLGVCPSKYQATARLS